MRYPCRCSMTIKYVTPGSVDIKTPACIAGYLPANSWRLLFDLQPGVVLLDERLDLIGLRQQLGPLFLIERDGKTAKAITLKRLCLFHLPSSRQRRSASASASHSSALNRASSRPVRLRLLTSIHPQYRLRIIPVHRHPCSISAAPIPRKFRFNMPEARWYDFLRRGDSVNFSLSISLLAVYASFAKLWLCWVGGFSSVPV